MGKIGIYITSDTWEPKEENHKNKTFVDIIKL